MRASIAQRIERFSRPKEGNLLALHFDQFGLLVCTLIGRGRLHEFRHCPSSVGSVQPPTSESVFAAITKSLRWSPWILWVHQITVTRPHSVSRAGGWPSF